jgi:hypothetical protein
MPEEVLRGECERHNHLRTVHNLERRPENACFPGRGPCQPAGYEALRTSISRGHPSVAAQLVHSPATAESLNCHQDECKPRHLGLERFLYRLPYQFIANDSFSKALCSFAFGVAQISDREKISTCRSTWDSEMQLRRRRPSLNFRRSSASHVLASAPTPKSVLLLRSSRPWCSSE